MLPGLTRIRDRSSTNQLESKGISVTNIPITNVRSAPLDWSNDFVFRGMTQLVMLGDGSCYFHSIAYAFYKPYRLGEINGVKLDRKAFIRNFRHDLAMKLGAEMDQIDRTLAVNPSLPIDEGSRLNRPNNSGNNENVEYTSLVGENGATQSVPEVSQIEDRSPSFYTGEKLPSGSQNSIDKSNPSSNRQNLTYKSNSSDTYYDTLSRGQLREFSTFYPSYILKNLQVELLSDRPVDSVYHEYVSNLLNKDIYILDHEKKDVYILPDPEIYYKGRNSIVLLWSNNHYDLVGLNTDKGIKTYFSPNSDFIRYIRSRIYTKTGKRLVVD